MGIVELNCEGALRVEELDSVRRHEQVHVVLTIEVSNATSVAMVESAQCVTACRFLLFSWNGRGGERKRTKAGLCKVLAPQLAARTTFTFTFHHSSIPPSAHHGLIFALFLIHTGYLNQLTSNDRAIHGRDELPCRTFTM